jgi:hypothetical protein
LGNGKERLGNWRLKVGNKMERKSQLETFQQPNTGSKWVKIFSSTSPIVKESVEFFSFLTQVPL